MAVESSGSRIYCTYFDSGYLARGLALVDSLRAHGDHSEIWILCLDEAAKVALDQLADPLLHTLTLEDLEVFEPALPLLKAGRSRMEYNFTCTPILIRYTMDVCGDQAAVAIYLDADLYFFDDPSLVLDAMGEGSVGIIEHKYPPRLAAKLGKYGRFNVGWVGFRQDERGRACLNWWSDSTLEWCFDRPENGKYADQGYLDWFPQKFQGVSVLTPLGLNLAPWNTESSELTLAENGAVRVDADPLVFFHFHGLRRNGGWYVTSQLVYGDRLRGVLRENVYTPYLKVLDREETKVAGWLGSVPKPAKRGNGVRGVIGRVRKTAINWVTIATGNAIRISSLDANPRG